MCWTVQNLPSENTPKLYPIPVRLAAFLASGSINWHSKFSPEPCVWRWSTMLALTVALKGLHSHHLCTLDSFLCWSLENVRQCTRWIFFGCSSYRYHEDSLPTQTMRPSPKRESLLKKLSRPNEDDTTKIRYCNAKPYKIYTNPTFHDLRSFPRAPLLNFRIQVTFLYHKGVHRARSSHSCEDQEIRSLPPGKRSEHRGNSGITNIQKWGQDFSEALLAWTPFTLAWFIYFPKQESESGRGTSLHIMYFQSYQCFELVVTKLISRTKLNPLKQYRNSSLIIQLRPLFYPNGFRFRPNT